MNSLLKEVTSYEKEAQDALKVIESVRGAEGKDEYDVRQAVSTETTQAIYDTPAK